MEKKWEYTKKIARLTGDMALYDFACRMQAAEEKYTPRAPWEMRGDEDE